MLNLTALPQRYVEALGRDKVAEIVGEKMPTVALWISKNYSFPLRAVEALLAFDPSPIHEIKPLYAAPEPGNKLAILIPLSGPPAPKMMDTFARLYDRHEMTYERFAFNNLSVSRNALAASFLRGPSQWAYWMDGDMMVPASDAAWYKREAEVPKMPDIFAGLNTIYRMLVHKKTIVSCSYVSRRSNAVPQFGGGEFRKNEIRRGPQDMVIEVPWAGMGGMITHRSVFEDIIKTQGAEIRMKPGGIGARFNYEYAFFNPIDLETCGDDVPFSIRATKAGHKVHVDLAVQAAHIGDRPYTFLDL